MSERAKVSAIRVPVRFRKDMGRIDKLADSMARLGQLQPIGVDADNTLLFGARRLAAAERLNWETIAVERFPQFSDALHRIIAELEENTCRKDFTPLEAITLAKAIEAAEKPKAAERRRATQNNDSAKAETSVTNFVEQGRTDEKAAEAVGYSRESLRKIEAVATAAEKDPETFGPVAETMDRTGKVDPAYRAVKRGKNGTAAKPHTPKASAPRPAKPAVPEHVRAVLKSLAELTRLAAKDGLRLSVIELRGVLEQHRDALRHDYGQWMK